MDSPGQIGKNLRIQIWGGKDRAMGGEFTGAKGISLQFK